MRISESRLRKIIRRALIEESFFSRITDPKKWKQFKKAVGHSAKKHGFSEGQLGEGLDYEGYLRYVFGENDYVNQLTETFDKLKKGELSEDNVMRTLRTISYDALFEYIGVTDHSVMKNKMAKMTVLGLHKISVRQLASSIKYFKSGGIEEVLSKRKKDLEMEFNRFIPIVVKMCNA